MRQKTGPVAASPALLWVYPAHGPEGLWKSGRGRGRLGAAPPRGQRPPASLPNRVCGRTRAAGQFSFLKASCPAPSEKMYPSSVQLDVISVLYLYESFPK